MRLKQALSFAFCLLSLQPALMAAQDTPAPPPAVHETGPHGEDIYKIGKDTTPPAILSKPEPRFSEAAVRAHASGKTMLMIIVDTEGVPQDVHVVRSMAESVKPKKQEAARSLDEMALEAVKQYRFKPAMHDGRPVAVKMYVEVDFQTRRPFF